MNGGIEGCAAQSHCGPVGMDNRGNSFQGETCGVRMSPGSQLPQKS
jgi:hypothetical protein